MDELEELEEKDRAIIKDGIYTYEYGFYYPPASRKLGSLATGMAGAYGYDNLLLLGIAAIVLVYVWSRGGTEVDFENRKYRDYQDFYLVKNGEWKSMKPSYISVFRARMGLEAGSVGRNYDFEQFQVNLVTENKKRINLYETEDLHQAFSRAEALSLQFNLRIWDATSREGRWHKEVQRKGPF
jgi:hypothetical protein